MGFWGFWILGILGILDFGFWAFGDFGFWAFGDFGFWGFWILGFWGGPGDVPLGNLVTVPGGQRLESPLVCLWGPLQNQLYRIELGQGSKLNIFSEVRTLQNHRKTLTSNPEVRTLQNHRKTQTSNPEVRTLQNHRKNPDFQPRGQSFTKSQKNLDFSPYRRILSILSIEAVVVCEKSSDSDSFILRNCNFIAMNFLAQINVDYPGRRPQAPACFKY